MNTPISGFRQRPRANRHRRGAVIVLWAMLSFVLLAIAGILIDIGMARLTQSQMQSVSDAAALEGGWQWAMGADEATLREAIVDRQSQADPTAPSLNANIHNENSGDIAIGQYDERQVPETLPGQPMGYQRGPAFGPTDFDNANALLVRLRRTGEAEIEGGSSAARLPYRWSAGSLLNVEQQRQGIAVRSESIVKLRPAVAVGSYSDAEQRVLTATTAAVRLSDLELPTYSFDSLLSVSEPSCIGALATDQSPDIIRAATQTDWYLPIAQQIPEPGGPWYVVGYTLVRFDDHNHATPLALAEGRRDSANASSHLPLAWATLSELDRDVREQILRVNQSIPSSRVLKTPTLVRSQQIQGVSL